MNIVLWIIASLLALVFLGAGLKKLRQPKEKPAESGTGLPPGLLKTVGALEVLAVIGLILPGLTNIASVLVPLAASGLVLIMVGAIVTHRKEPKMIILNVVLLVLAAVVAWGRFGPYSFTS